MSMYERVKEVCDGYIEQCVQAKLPPRQAIEIRLAFYGGMIACFHESALISGMENEDDAMLKMQEFFDAVKKRGVDLDMERSAS